MSDAKPLANKRILVGRARHQASALSSGLRELGASVLEIPFIEIRRPSSFGPLDDALKNLASYQWLILTSVNGVDAMWERLSELKLTVPDLRIAAIGPATRTAIQDRGIRVDVVPKEYVAESVVSSLRSEVRAKRVLLVRAKVARDVIPDELRKAGAEVDVVEAYETVVPASSRTQLRSIVADAQQRPEIITFTSSSSVRNFLELLGSSSPASVAGIKLASIGPVTSATLREVGLPVHIEAREYTIPGLIQAIVAANAN